MSNEIETITESKIQEYINTFMSGTNLTAPETMQFIEIAKAYQLNPFKREIYCIAYGTGEKRKLSILTGYEVYLKRAERLKMLDGWSVEVKGTLNPIKKTVFRYGKNQLIDSWSGDLSATITIYRKDWKLPFIHTVDFDEYNQNNDIWISKPKTMIKKVAISTGFRLCFPDEMGGMPYTSDELPDETIKERIINEAPIDIKQTESSKNIIIEKPEPGQAMAVKEILDLVKQNEFYLPKKAQEHFAKLKINADGYTPEMYKADKEKLLEIQAIRLKREAEIKLVKAELLELIQNPKVLKRANAPDLDYCSDIKSGRINPDLNELTELKQRFISLRDITVSEQAEIPTDEVEPEFDLMPVKETLPPGVE